MGDPVTWQEAVKAAIPVAHEAWRLAGLPGPHVVLTKGCLDGGARWVVVHGAAPWLVDADDAGQVWDPPAVVVDKATGVVDVVTPPEAFNGPITVVGDVPEHLR